MRIKLALLVAALVVLAPAELLAGGIFLPGRGVRPMGRAGASVASSGGNLNAIWYNPANLAGLEERKLTVDTSVIGTFSTFDRAPRTTPNGQTKTYPPVSNQALPVPDPQAMIGGPTGLEGLSWAAGFWAPYSGYHRYPQDGPQRYSIIDRSGSVVAYLGGSVGYQISDKLRVGLGVQNMITDVKLVTTVSGYSGLYGRPEDESLDILARMNTRDLFVPTGNLGLWYAISDTLQTAFSVQLPARVRDEESEVEIRKGSHPSFDEVEVRGNSVSTGVTMPVMVRGALRYTASQFDVELAAVFEGWSVFDEPTIRPTGIEVREVPGADWVPLEPIRIPRNWRDTISIRLGGDYAFSRDLTLRAGYAFETSAIPDGYYDVLVLDAAKHLISGGMSYDFNDKLTLDASLAYYAFHTRRIEDSNVRQIAPMDPDDEHAVVVGNGTYRTSNLVVGAGVNWRF